MRSTHELEAGQYAFDNRCWPRACRFGTRLTIQRLLNLHWVASVSLLKRACHRSLPPATLGAKYRPFNLRYKRYRQRLFEACLQGRCSAGSPAQSDHVTPFLNILRGIGVMHAPPQAVHASCTAVRMGSCT